MSKMIYYTYLGISNYIKVATIFVRLTPRDIPTWWLSRSTLFQWNSKKKTKTVPILWNFIHFFSAVKTPIIEEWQYVWRSCESSTAILWFYYLWYYLGSDVAKHQRLGRHPFINILHYHSITFQSYV